MKRLGVLVTGVSLAFMGLAAILYLSPTQIVMAATTTTTTTTTSVIGWLFPDGGHWNNGIGAVLYPLSGVGLFAGLAKVLGLEGEFGATLILVGMVIGALLAMLSINASSANLLPFALVIVPAVDLILWMWKGEG